MKQCQNCGQENASHAAFCESCGHAFEVKKVNPCPSCGVDNEEEASFCENCGTKLVAETPPINKEEKRCPNCQHELEEGAAFCENCGTKVLEEKIEIEPQNVESNEVPLPKVEEEVMQRPKQPVSKKNKIIGLVVAICLVFGGGLYAFFSQQNSQEKQIESLVVAIKNKDTSYLVDRMVTEDPSLTINEESLQPMLKYFEENKEDINTLKKALETQQFFNGFSLKAEGKVALLFTKYNIQVTPAYSTIESNVKNSVILMDGKEVATTDSNKYSKKIGPLIPGVYSFEATIKNKKDKKESTYTLLPKGEEPVDMRFVMVKIPIRSNMKDATVLINDKEAGKLTDGETEIGPLLWNNKMKVQLVKKTDTDKLKTDVKELKQVDVDEDSGTYPEIVLNFNSADDYDIESGIKLFYDDFSHVVDSNSHFEPSEFASKYYVDGDKNASFSGIKDYINWCRERSSKREYEGVTFNVNVKSVEPLSNNTYKIKYNVVYRTTYPYSTKKTPRIEGFDYSDVKVQFEQDEDSSDVKNFKFIDMGDGGKKVEDNRANE